MMIKISFDDNDDDLDLKVNIFSLVNLCLQLPHNGCICRPPVSFIFKSESVKEIKAKANLTWNVVKYLLVMYPEGLWIVNLRIFWLRVSQLLKTIVDHLKMPSTSRQSGWERKSMHLVITGGIATCNIPSISHHFASFLVIFYHTLSYLVISCHMLMNLLKQSLVGLQHATLHDFCSFFFRFDINFLRL